MKDEGKLRIDDKSSAIEKLLDLSYELNKSISSFNEKNDIGNLVRKKENVKFLLEYYEKLFPHSKKTIKSRKEKVGDDFVTVTEEYLPFLCQKDLRVKMKTLKSEKRDIQGKIDKLNAENIELPFDMNEYDDIISMLS